MIIICEFNHCDMTFLITQYSSHDSLETYKTWKWIHTLASVPATKSFSSVILSLMLKR